jgi:hypothetical protein
LVQLLNVARTREPGSAVTSDYLERGTAYLRRYPQLSTPPFDKEIAR